MTPYPWPCHKCGSEGIKNLGTQGWCSTHLAALYETFTPNIWKLDGGIGLPNGQQRPDLGPAIQELRCCACQATWAGLVGEQCTYCTLTRNATIRHQAELALTPPDNLDNEHALQAWAARMRTAVAAGILDNDQARRAWKRTVLRGAA